jgi:hypothetical protein
MNDLDGIKIKITAKCVNGKYNETKILRENFKMFDVHLIKVKIKRHRRQRKLRLPKR